MGAVDPIPYTPAPSQTPPTPQRENNPGPSATCFYRSNERGPRRTWFEVCEMAFPLDPLNFALGFSWAG